MRFRHLVLAAAIIAAFVYLTTYSPMRPFGPGNWRGPLPWERGATPVSNVTLAQGERFSPDEQNNIEVYKAASPAVVNITTVTLAYDFFLNAVPVESGAGSGFLIDADGDIVTNYHVISGARQVQVTMADKSRFKAQVVGADPRSDLAVVRVSAEKKLPYLQLGDSKNLQVGQKVLAIGNPFGQFQNTLTTGVISSLGRSVRDPDSRNVLEDVIQTDAAINPGNSAWPACWSCRWIRDCWWCASSRAARRIRPAFAAAAARSSWAPGKSRSAATSSCNWTASRRSRAKTCFAAWKTSASATQSR
ncbi:MAG: trypsin-like peptidase domain-containing protein [Acidobacteria bacterium]|nr:trypsin-like peptidase domain-containing protein [Acidobacteriota bacterium]